MSVVGYKNVVDDWGEGWRSPDRQSSLFANRPGIKETVGQPRHVNPFRQLVGPFFKEAWKTALRPELSPRLANDPALRTAHFRVPDMVSAKNEMNTSRTKRTSRPLLSGIAGFAVRLWQRSIRLPAQPPRLMLIEKITIGPRQSLSLIEAEGVRVLIATSAEGTPALVALSSIGGAHLFPESRRTVPSRLANRCLATERRKSNQPDARSVWKSRISW